MADALPWFRLYAEFATDLKVQTMPEAMQRRLVMLFCLRCNGQETFQDDEIMHALKLDETEMKRTKVFLVAKNFVSSDWKIVNWNKRQFLSDSSTSRVRKHRAKKILKQSCNVSATPPDTDSERKKDSTAPQPVTTSAPDPERAAFRKVFDFGSDLFPGLMAKNTASISKWLEAGASPDLDIIPSLKASAGREIKSWNYFDGAVMDAKANRLKPLPNGKAHETDSRSPSRRPGKSEEARAAIFRGLGLADAEA